MPLHELACTGPTPDEGCVCQPKGSVARMDAYKAAPDWLVAGHAASVGIDMHLSSLETLMTALEQRALTEDQLDRFARILQYGERVALTTLRARQRPRRQRA